MVRKIVIFGGGTSGWLTAAYLTNNLVDPVEIQLIEDASKGPIGVGEGTQPLTASFLYKCGINAKDWMKPSNASFKLKKLVLSGDLHNFDISLFWGSLRANIKDRINAFI